MREASQAGNVLCADVQVCLCCVLQLALDHHPALMHGATTTTINPLAMSHATSLLADHAAALIMRARLEQSVCSHMNKHNNDWSAQAVKERTLDFLMQVCVAAASMGQSMHVAGCLECRTSWGIKFVVFFISDKSNNLATWKGHGTKVFIIANVQAEKAMSAADEVLRMEPVLWEKEPANQRIKVQGSAGWGQGNKWRQGAGIDTVMVGARQLASSC